EVVGARDVEVELEAFWVGRGGQRRARRLDVAPDVRARVDAVVVRRRDRRARGGHAAGTEQGEVDDRLLVDRVGDRPADVHVVERRTLDVEVDAAEVRGQAADDLDVRVGPQDID